MYLYFISPCGLNLTPPKKNPRPNKQKQNKKGGKRHTHTPNKRNTPTPLNNRPLYDQNFWYCPPTEFPAAHVQWLLAMLSCLFWKAEVIVHWQCATHWVKLYYHRGADSIRFPGHISEIMKEVLTQTQLKNLKEHKYSATGQSLIEPWFQIYWRWLIEQVPVTWAPNSITLLGLVINIVTTLLLVVCSPDSVREVNITIKCLFPVFRTGNFRANLKSITGLAHWKLYDFW